MLQLARRHFVATELLNDPSPPKPYNRHQKKLHQILCSDSSNYVSDSWNQDALLQLIHHHPQVCQVLYDFSPRDDDHVTRVTSDNSVATRHKSRSSRLQYPLSRLFQMPSMPSIQLVYAAHQAHPTAINEADAEGQNILHLLCANARAAYTEAKALISLVRYIIAAEGSLVKVPTKILGATPLHAAARFGASLEVVSLLIEQYPETLQSTTTNGETPLLWACQNVDLSFASVLVPFLLQQGASALHTNKQGESALHILLQSHRQTPSSFRSPSANKVIIVLVQAILEQDASNSLLFKSDVFGRVPLHVALSFGSYPLEVIQFLVVHHPACLWVRDLSGFTPMHLACLYPAQLDVVQYLLQTDLIADNEGGLFHSPLPSRMPEVLGKTSCVSLFPNNAIKRKDCIPVEDQDACGNSSNSTSMTSVSSSPSTSRSSSPSYTLPCQECDSVISLQVSQASLHSRSTFGIDDENSFHTKIDKSFDASAILDELLDGYHLRHPSAFKLASQTDPTTDRHAFSELRVPILRIPNSSNALPLHLACEFWTSFEVVKTLVEHDPQALRRVDDQASTPLHLACARLAPFEMLQYLVQKYPESIYLKDYQGRLPIHVAMETLPIHCTRLSAVLELLLGVELLWITQEEVYDTNDLRDVSHRCTSIRQATTCRGESAFKIAVRRQAPTHILLLLAPRYTESESSKPKVHPARRSRPVPHIQVPTPVIEASRPTNLPLQSRCEI